MKRTILAASAAAALSFGVGGAVVDAGPPAGAGDGGKPAGVACKQHGHGLLRSLGSPAKVSAEVVGLPLSAVLQLHLEDPAAAAGVLESLGLPAGPCDVDA